MYAIEYTISRKLLPPEETQKAAPLCRLLAVILKSGLRRSTFSFGCVQPRPKIVNRRLQLATFALCRKLMQRLLPFQRNMHVAPVIY